MPLLNQTPTSEELLKLVGAGNANAWTSFYNSYKDPMIAYARSRLPSGKRQLAEEVVQDVFVALARRMSDFKYESSQGRFRDYLATCIRNRIMDRLKAEQRETEDKKELAERLMEKSPKRSCAFADSLLAEAVKRVRESGRLEQATWDVYRENVVDGLPAAEVAAQHGIEANAVYQIKNRVSKMVRDEYNRLNQLRPWHE